MTVKEQLFTLVAAVFYIAVIYMLVRPNSNGPTLVNNVSNVLSDLVRGSIGYSYDASTGQWVGSTA